MGLTVRMNIKTLLGRALGALILLSVFPSITGFIGATFPGAGGFWYGFFVIGVPIEGLILAALAIVAFGLWLILNDVVRDE